MNNRIIYGLLVGAFAALGVSIGHWIAGGFDTSDLIDWKSLLGAFIGGSIGGFFVWKKHNK